MSAPFREARVGASGGGDVGIRVLGEVAKVGARNGSLRDLEKLLFGHEVSYPGCWSRDVRYFTVWGVDHFDLLCRPKISG